MMSNGAKNRATAATGMNEGSSRSHSVFMVTVTQRHLETGSTKTGKLFLVDLAGSEMVRKTHASGQQLEEAKTINKSLSALGLVINALTDEKAQHFPYRDSKLTRVLQDSLGGNSKTVLVINTSPSSYNASETLSTCRFGSRAKSITNKPKINEERSVEELSALLQKAENAIDMQQSYILALEGQLRSATGQGGPVAVGGDDGMHNEILALQSKVASLTAELAEEREESTRREREVKNLTAMMVDKEQLLTQAGELMTEAERHCEVHREKVEELEGEKSKLMDEMLEVKEELRQVHISDLSRSPPPTSTTTAPPLPRLAPLPSRQARYAHAPVLLSEICEKSPSSKARSYGCMLRSSSRTTSDSSRISMRATKWVRRAPARPRWPRAWTTLRRRRRQRRLCRRLQQEVS